MVCLLETFYLTDASYIISDALQQDLRALGGFLTGYGAVIKPQLMADSVDMAKQYLELRSAAKGVMQGACAQCHQSNLYRY